MRQLTLCALTAVLFLTGCATTPGGATTGGGPPPQQHEQTAALVGGTLLGGLLGLALCKAGDGKDCEKYVLGGAAAGAAAFYVLNQRQQQIYAAAQDNDVQVTTIEYVDGDNGYKKTALVLEDEWYDSADSVELSAQGRRKLEQVLPQDDAATEEGMAINITYDPEDDESRRLAEARAKSLRRRFGDNIRNASFGTVGVRDSGGEQKIVVE